MLDTFPCHCWKIPSLFVLTLKEIVRMLLAIASMTPCLCHICGRVLCAVLTGTSGGMSKWRRLIPSSWKLPFSPLWDKHLWLVSLGKALVTWRQSGGDLKRMHLLQIRLWLDCPRWLHTAVFRWSVVAYYCWHFFIKIFCKKVLMC